MSALEGADDVTRDARTPAAGAPCGCDEAVERLWEYVDSELGPLDRDRVQEHLDACVSCLEEEQVEVVMKELVRRCCQEEAPATLHVRIREQIMVLRLRAGVETQS